jgi:hypothetical protein
VRYRTAALSCFVLVAGMFGLPAIVWAVFLPSLRQGLPNPIPVYERVILDIAVFCGNWKWVLLLPLLGLGIIFTIAEATLSRAPGNVTPVRR